MSKKYFIIFALLPFLFYAQEEMDPRVFVKRIQEEIAACRQKAESVQQATEDDWKRHSERVQALQKEADELSVKLRAVSDKKISVEAVN